MTCKVLEQEVPYLAMMHGMKGYLDEAVAKRAVKNEDPGRWSIHPQFGALQIVGGRELSNWLLADHPTYIGLARSFAYTPLARLDVCRFLWSCLMYPCWVTQGSIAD